MSWHVTSFVMRHSEETLGARLVLLVLAEHAEHDGTRAYPAVATICRESRLSERGVQTNLRKLEDSGAITLTGTWKGVNVYRVNLPDAYFKLNDVAHPKVEGADSAGAQNGAAKGADSAPDSVLGLDPEHITRRAPAKVGLKKVTAEEDALATEVMAHFNFVFKSDFTAREHFVGIIERFRNDRPTWTAAEFKEAVNRLAGQSWWQHDRKTNRLVSRPSPRHVFGSGKALDFVMNAELESEQPEAESSRSAYTKA